MARPTRLLLPETPVHVIQRGNNRGACFVHRRDATHYLAMLDEARQICEVAIHAYVLMTNHVHLLATPRGDPDGISTMMKGLGQRYVQYFNRRHERTGGLFEGRYRSCLVAEPRYLFACYRYIELNPVRAGMVESPGEYRWSSFAANALGRHDPLITAHAAYDDLARRPELRCERYRQLFDTDLPNGLIDEIRRQTHRGKPLGQLRGQTP
ncbi:transposase [Halomonas getboli]|uniref:transposase n=1 Tax=Halomonas getboli TaxID=2935862 RepID=UPI001FFE2E3F|nr:transposase [Halomonas getboli]MCK2182986.1 transposase [Halomonas getboli]